jgi:hypothetical protein
MRRDLVFACALAALLSAAFSASALPARLSRGPRETGMAVLRDLSIHDGILSFRVDSGGCTDAASFRVRAEKEEGVSPKSPHFRLTIERVRIDECKAMLWEGVVIQIDLARDVGLKGAYTVTVTNPVQRADDGLDGNRALLGATVRAIGLEEEATRRKLKAAEEGTGPRENIERFRAKLASLAEQQRTFAAMSPADYPAPVRQEPDAASILEQSMGWGPVLPPLIRELVVNVDGPLADDALLSVEGTSKSGPFYHLAGIEGGDYGMLKKGRRYRFIACLVYRREYVGLIGDYSVYVMDVR